MANADPYIARPVRRLAAGAVDLFLCGVLVLFGWGVVYAATSASTLIELVFLNEVAFVAYAGYHAAFYYLFHGQTPGLFLFGMRLVRASDGCDPSIGLALVRATFRPLSVNLFGIAALLAQRLFSPLASIVALPLLVELGMMFILVTRQTLSDVICKTLVVNVPPS